MMEVRMGFVAEELVGVILGLAGGTTYHQHHLRKLGRLAPSAEVVTASVSLHEKRRRLPGIQDQDH